MAWTATNPVSVGNPTKKKDYDKLWDNCQYIKTNVMPSGTVMIFGQNSPPTGWTIKTDWTNNSMLVYTTDAAITGGGSATPWAHNHKWYYTDGDSSGLTFNAAGAAVAIPFRADGGGHRITCSTEAAQDSITSTAYTANGDLLYQKVIAATKDAY